MTAALILVGGFGTRLRPLTLTKPKPLVEFCNMAILEHQVEALVAVGVKKIVLAVSYKADDMIEMLKALEAKYGVAVICSQEDEPMGTGACAPASARRARHPRPRARRAVPHAQPYPPRPLLQPARSRSRARTLTTARVSPFSSSTRT
jgi:CTP:molybdopterin cytidylyltransferase MocA